MKFEYSSNNSGGEWWLTDDDWRALEEAGWEVEWFKEGDCFGMVKEDGRWLGSLATSASKNFETLRDCVDEFERVTGAAVADEGCGCCGPPHSFSWQGGYASGEELLRCRYGDDASLSKEELLRKLAEVSE